MDQVDNTLTSQKRTRRQVPNTLPVIYLRPLHNLVVTKVFSSEKSSVSPTERYAIVPDENVSHVNIFMVLSYLVLDYLELHCCRLHKSVEILFHTITRRRKMHQPDTQSKTIEFLGR